MSSFAIAFGISILAALSTVLGSALVFFKKVNPSNKRVLSAGLAFASGIMIFLSFVEMYTHAVGEFTAEYSASDEAASIAHLMTLMFYFIGIIVIIGLDKIQHQYFTYDPHHALDIVASDDFLEVFSHNSDSTDGLENSETPHSTDTEMNNGPTSDNPSTGNPIDQSNPTNPDPAKHSHHKELYATGIKAAMAIALHNFPEGLATFIGSYSDPVLGAAIAIAVSLHNIPEGIAIAIPIYYSTHSKKKAFLFCLAAGLTELFGALVGFFIIIAGGDAALPYLIAAVAGIMAWVSFTELLPAAIKFNTDKHTVHFFLFLGQLIMGASLILLNMKDVGHGSH